jgi:tetratricopeptide (TPR) repeat protein
MTPVPRKKEIGAMRIGVIVIITAFALSACTHLTFNKKINALKAIQPGDTQEVVFQTMGPPDLRNDITDQRFVAYYQTKPGELSDGRVTEALCTPVAFENGQVVAVGDDLAERWAQEEQERIRRLAKAERERQQAEMAKAAAQRAIAERQQKIAALENEVKPVPVSNATLNLKLYRQLLELDPDNSRYQKKVADYEVRLAKQKKANQERAIRAAKAKQRQAWERAREGRNQKLRQYTGNGIAEMAVHDMGNGSLYVWVKNVSKQIITTHPDNFKLVDNANNPVRCTISDSLDSVLEPGGISHGKFECDREIEPKEIIFQNRESGRISKSFQ